MTKIKIFLVSLILISYSTQSFSQVWSNVQFVKAEFSLKNAGITVNGKFTDVVAAVSVDQASIANSSFSGTIQAKSVNTDNTTRDNHLRNKAEFFNVSKYPTITMKAVKINPIPNDRSYKVDWIITMKGISRKLTTDVLINRTDNSIFILTVFKINRRDWKVGTKGILMSDDVLITLSANLLK
ncbi:MAG TPA: YceI family protein [Chitinophagaceae bacterium]|nr:YceI family protein [Chitinophagaceae bacterium]